MKKKVSAKQVAAIIAIVLLVAMYIATLFVAIFDKSNTMRMFYAAIGCTVFIPIVLWIFIATYQWVSRTRQDNQKTSKTKGPISVNGVSSEEGEDKAGEEDSES